MILCFECLDALDCELPIVKCGNWLLDYINEARWHMLLVLCCLDIKHITLNRLHIVGGN